MSRGSAGQAVLSSVLDRLLEGDQASAPSKTAAQTLRELKLTVRRDLENLLNTRWRCTSWPPDLRMIDTSLVNYGIPDFAGANLGASEARDNFRRIIEKAINAYEPRLTKVSVRVVGNTEPLDRTLRFRIDAVLRADPAPEPVQFDTALETSSAAFSVKGVEH